MSKDFHHRGYVELPNWVDPLRSPYWRIRVEGRCAAKRRKAYREVRRIRLSLVEQGHDPELITAICRYLVSFRESAAVKVALLLKTQPMQSSLF